MKASLTLFAALTALAGCTEAPRNLNAELDANMTSNQVLLSCKESGSGTCYAIFVGDGKTVSLQAAAGASASAALGNGGDYCVDVSPPDPARCHPRPLVPGKQIVRMSKAGK